MTSGNSKGQHIAEVSDQMITHIAQENKREGAEPLPLKMDCKRTELELEAHTQPHVERQVETSVQINRRNPRFQEVRVILPKDTLHVLIREPKLPVIGDIKEVSDEDEPHLLVEGISVITVHVEFSVERCATQRATATGWDLAGV